MGMVIGKNWKTTVSGAALICGAIYDILTAISNGTPPHIEADFTGFVSGIGLVFAKDFNVTGGDVHQTVKDLR